MIYSVVPLELGEEVFARLVERYKDNPNITVIMDRRKGDRRKDNAGHLRRLTPPHSRRAHRGRPSGPPTRRSSSPRSCSPPTPTSSA